MPPSQARCSTNWNCAVVGSKSRHSTSDSAKVTSVVHSAMKRALRSAASSSPRKSSDQQRAEQRQEGDGGEDRPGSAHQWQPSPAEHEIGDDQRHADQHDEGVVIEVAGLQPDDAVGDVDARAPTTPSGPMPSMTVPSPVLPQEAADPLRRTHEEEVVELVEVPGVAAGTGRAPRKRLARPNGMSGLVM